MIDYTRVPMIEEGESQMRKLIHQVWVQGLDNLPDKFTENRRRWQEAFPDFEMILWDDESASQQWADYREHTADCYHHATRCDLILARAVRDFGGLATGTDAVPTNPPRLRAHLETHDTMVVFLAQGPNASTGLQWSSQPGHRFWELVAQHQLREDASLLATIPPNKATGPWCYTECLELYDGDDLEIVPGELAYTHYFNPKRSWDSPDAFIDPGYAKSWVKKASS